MDRVGGTEQQHLDATSWRALLEQASSGGVSTRDALVQHLSAGCEVCDAFLAAHVDDFDGELDRVLLRLTPVAQAPLDEVGWMRIRRRLKGGTAPIRRWIAVGSLAAAVTLVTGAVVLNSSSHPENRTSNGIKGRVGGPMLEVAAALRTGDGAFVRLDDGAHLRRDAVLVFRAESSVDGLARIYLQRGSDPPTEIGEAELRAGTHEIRTDTGLLGVSLEGERGDLNVWIVVGDGPFSSEAAVRAIQSGGSAELATARVNVNVE